MPATRIRLHIKCMKKVSGAVIMQVSVCDASCLQGYQLPVSAPAPAVPLAGVKFQAWDPFSKHGSRLTSSQTSALVTQRHCNASAYIRETARIRCFSQFPIKSRQVLFPLHRPPIMYAFSCLVHNRLLAFIQHNKTRTGLKLTRICFKRIAYLSSVVCFWLLHCLHRCKQTCFNLQCHRIELFSPKTPLLLMIFLLVEATFVLHCSSHLIINHLTRCRR